MLIFDGDCGFCTTTARWMERHVASDVDVVPWQKTDLDSLGLTVDDVTSAAYWVDDTATLHRGHRGVGRALLAFGGAWRMLGWLCLVPPTSWVGAVVYRLVARYRHRLPGGTPACRIDVPNQQGFSDPET